MESNNPPPASGDGGKNIIITGASRGLGYAIAEIFAENGYDLFLTSVNESKLYKAVEELQKNIRALPLTQNPLT